MDKGEPYLLPIPWPGRWTSASEGAQERHGEWGMGVGEEGESAMDREKNQLREAQGTVRSAHLLSVFLNSWKDK